MQIVLALIFGAAVGTLFHFVLPGRSVRGVVLAPMIGAVVAGIVWAILTWLGQTTASPWLWLGSAVAPFVIVPLILPVLTRARHKHDARTRAELGI